MKWTRIAAAGQTIYLIDENGRAWCVEYYGITERERWKEIVHPDDLSAVDGRTLVLVRSHTQRSDDDADPEHLSPS